MQHHFHFHLHHHARHHARYDVDMTQGSTTRHLVRFALPLLAGNLFQQLYNMVDTWVVGNFVSNEAFSAVGTVTPIINTLIGFFLGMSSGAGVVISQYYGAHRPEKVREAVHTAMLLTVIMGVVFTGVGIAMTPLMLELMKTPAEVAPDQTAYLTIYFAGIMGLLLYNMGSGILRAVGDSQRPFYFLLVSAGVNTALDLLFVLKFGMGVEGVAYATIIAQAVSAVLTLWVLMGAEGGIRLELRALRFTWSVLRQIVAGYIELSRNTPLLIQLFFIYYGLPKIGIKTDPAVCGVVGLAFLGGSYMAEAFRSGLEAIEPIQQESALSLGLTRGQTMRYVILPQAMSISMPAFMANVIFLLKETSVFSAVSLMDLMFTAKDLIAMYAKTTEALALLVVCYLLILLPVSLLGSWLERRLRYA